MAKSLSERIAARAVKKTSPRYAQNKATFLALRGEIKQALEDGWPVKSAWETLFEEGKIDFGYQAFRGYVNRLILSAPATKSTAQTQTIVTDPGLGQGDKPGQSDTKSTMEKQEKPTTLKGFSFNPEPKKEDYL